MEKNNEIDFDKMMEIIDDAPMSYHYFDDELVYIKKPSFIISKENMVILFNHIKQLN